MKQIMENETKRKQILELELEILKKELELVTFGDCKHSMSWFETVSVVEGKRKLTYKQLRDIQDIIALLVLGRTDFSSNDHDSHKVVGAVDEIIEILELDILELE